MRNIASKVQQWLAAGESVAVARIVEIEGFGSRRGGEALAFNGAKSAGRLLGGTADEVLRDAAVNLAGGAAISALYTAALIITSLQSTTEHLPLGQTKHFCGFYLDCHIGVAVAAVEQHDALADSTGTVLAKPLGRFWLVRVRMSSDARGATLTAVEPLIEVVDSAGTHYAPSALGRKALAALRGPQPALAGSYTPGGERYAWFAFDLPANVHGPSLLVRDDLGALHVEETILIGDEDALWHARELLSLTPERAPR